MSRSAVRRNRHRKIRSYKNQLTKRFVDNGGECVEEFFSTGQFPDKYFYTLKSDYLRCGIEIYNEQRCLSGIYFSMRLIGRK